jgi:hypothetical protein
MSGVLVAAAALRDALRAFDPALLSGDDCALVTEELAATEKMCSAARAGAAARAARCGARSTRHFPDPAEWLARITGSTAMQARAAMNTAEAVASCPATKAAWEAGELSAEQAREIVTTERECPGSEAGLLATAGQASLGALRQQARDIRLGALDPEALHQHQRAAQEARHWKDDLGMVCLRVAFPPEVGVPIVNRLDAETDRLWRRGRREGRDDPRPVLAAKALAAMLTGEGTGKGTSRSADVVFVCDLTPAAIEPPGDGVRSHIIGGGPVAPSVVLDAIERGAFVKAVLHDGVQINTVCHYGRRGIPAVLRSALELGQPPRFDGITCIQANCDRRYRTQWDHVDPVANGGPTTYENLQPRCAPHHRQKTELDRLAGLLDRRRRAHDPP